MFYWGRVVIVVHCIYRLLINIHKIKCIISKKEKYKSDIYVYLIANFLLSPFLKFLNNNFLCNIRNLDLYW